MTRRTRTRYPKKPTRAQKRVVPNMMAALVRAETRTIEEIEREMEARGEH